MKAAVPERAMVPRLSTSSVFDMPTPLSRMVIVLALGSIVMAILKSGSPLKSSGLVIAS